MASETSVLVGHIVEEAEVLDAEQLCSLCAVERQYLLELVEHGVVEAVAAGELRFAGASLRRVRLAMRLRRDLGVNAAGVALVIELLDRIDALERRTGPAVAQR
jgi:chaperone modulatory protein CbpM